MWPGSATKSRVHAVLFLLALAFSGTEATPELSICATSLARSDREGLRYALAAVVSRLCA